MNYLLVVCEFISHLFDANHDTVDPFQDLKKGSVIRSPKQSQKSKWKGNCTGSQPEPTSTTRSQIQAAEIKLRCKYLLK